MQFLLRYQDDRRSNTQERFDREDRKPAYYDDPRSSSFQGGSGNTSQIRGYQTRDYQSQQTKNSSNHYGGPGSSRDSTPAPPPPPAPAPQGELMQVNNFVQPFVLPLPFVFLLCVCICIRFKKIDLIQSHHLHLQ